MERRRSSLRGWISELIQAPGTANVSRFEQVAGEIIVQAEALEFLPLEQLSTEVAGLADSLAEELDHAPDRRMSRRRVHAKQAQPLTRFFSLASEIARRTLGLVPYEVQVLAALNMVHGRAVDMKTGEGKTLVGFLASGTFAVSGRSVHVLTANDYLAQRDAAAAAPFFEALGLTVAAVTPEMSVDERRAGYRADVVYATIHQVGFDLLRDRLRYPDDATRLEPAHLAPRLDVAIIDEIDAVLIDDAMVPLVLAGEAPQQGPAPEIFGAVRELQPGADFTVGADQRSASFTESGLRRLELLLGSINLYAPEHEELLTWANLALHAEALMRRDEHYTVEGGRIHLVSESRGRITQQQRWPDGLQEAVEIKEGLAVSASSQILDQVLVESVARRYETLTGMSGTAAEVAERLQEDLGVLTGTIPLHRELQRVDHADRLFLTLAQRDAAAADRVRAYWESGQPVLVGTTSVRASEEFARLLTERGVPAAVLNAKNDAEEARIIASAGESGRVTVSTQMAGRGVDILLDDSAVRAGGLVTVGLGRYASSRLDNQLRGRAGRQGDPGESIFFTSLEDPVVAEHLIVETFPEADQQSGEIFDREYRHIYAHAQRIAEGKLFELHRTTRSYSEIIDRQRAAWLRLRGQILDAAALPDLELTRDVLHGLPEHARTRWSHPDSTRFLHHVLLFHVDSAWSDHLALLQETREGIHLRALGRQHPLDEFSLLAGQAYAELRERLVTESAAALAAAAPDAADLQDLGLRRPSSTWTYMVTDTPFGSGTDHLIERFTKATRKFLPRAVRYR